MKIGSTDISDVKIGSAQVQEIRQGSDLIWTSYLLDQSGTLSAGDESAWSTTAATASFSRVNSDTEFQFSSSNAATAYIDLWNYLGDGDIANVSLRIVTVAPGDSIVIGLSSTTTNETVTQPFAGSPFTSSDNGSTLLLASQTIDSTKRYLKIACSVSTYEQINFNNVRLRLA